jgi:membrane protein
MKKLDGLTERADALQRRWGLLGFVVAVQRKFSDDRAADLAALIAYFTFVALFPLLLAAISVVDIVARNDAAARRAVLDWAAKVWPQFGPQVAASLHSGERSTIALIVGLAAALVAARKVVLALQNGLNSVWEVPQDRRPAFPASAVRGIGIIGVVVIGQIVTLVLSGLAVRDGHLISSIPDEVGTVSVSLAANIGIFWVSFMLGTAAEVTWKDLRLGAIASALSWQALQLLGGFFLGHWLGRSSALYGVFGIVLGLLAWLYLQSQIMMYAVEMCTVRAWRLWPRGLRPPPTAQDRLAFARYAGAERRLPGGSPRVPPYRPRTRARRSSGRAILGRLLTKGRS